MPDHPATIARIGTRGTLVTFHHEDWDTHAQILEGNHTNYLIDTGLGADCASVLLDALKPTGKPTILINTHHHWDHIWGNGAFAGAVIIAHTLCRERVLDRFDAMKRQYGQFAMGAISLTPPNTLFDASLRFCDDKITLFHTPGHTADSISLYDEMDEILHVGDNIGDSWEDILPSLEMDKETYARTISRYQALPAKLCVSGHMEITTPDVWDRILDALADPSEAFQG